MYSAPNLAVFNTVHYVALATFFSVFCNSSYYYCINFYFLVINDASYNLNCIVLVRHREEKPPKSSTRPIPVSEIFHLIKRCTFGIAGSSRHAIDGRRKCVQFINSG